MFIIGKHAIFTLFALILIKKQCNADDDDDDISKEELVISPKPIYVMDKLQNLNMSYYCKFQANDFGCRDVRRDRKYFYDIKQQICRPFDYGHCDHSYNMFNDRRLCLNSCRDAAVAPVSENATANVYCRYQPDFGDCSSYHPSFYFDISEKKCKGFGYSGCGGNRNRFTSVVKCLEICETAVKHGKVKI